MKKTSTVLTALAAAAVLSTVFVSDAQAWYRTNFYGQRYSYGYYGRPGVSFYAGAPFRYYSGRSYAVGSYPLYRTYRIYRVPRPYYGLW